MDAECREYDIYEYIEQNVRRYAGDIKSFYNARPWELEYLSFEEFDYYVDDYLRSI